MNRPALQRNNANGLFAPKLDGDGLRSTGHYEFNNAIKVPYGASKVEYNNGDKNRHAMRTDQPTFKLDEG